MVTVLKVSSPASATSALAKLSKPTSFRLVELSCHRPSGRGLMFVRPFSSALRISMPRCWVLGSKACTTPPEEAISRAISTAWSPK